MAISQVGSANNGNGNGGTTVAVTLPAATAIDDLCVVALSVHGTTVSAAPTGWVAVVSNLTSGANLHFYVYRFKATAAGATTHTWTLALSKPANITVDVLRGVEPDGDPVDVLGATNTGTAGTTATGLAITPGVSQSWGLALYGARSTASRTWSAASWRLRSSGFSGDGDANDFAGTAVADSNATLANGVSTGNKAITLSGSSDWAAVLLNVKVASAKKSVAGSVSSSAVVFKEGRKFPAGTVSSSSAVVRLASKGLASGISSASGGLLRETRKGLAGAISSISSVGLVRIFGKAVAGAIASGGSLVKLCKKGLAGSLASAGSVLKGARKFLASAIASAGSLLSELTGLGVCVEGNAKPDLVGSYAAAVDLTGSYGAAAELGMASWASVDLAGGYAAAPDLTGTLEAARC